MVDLNPGQYFSKENFRKRMDEAKNEEERVLEVALITDPDARFLALLQDIQVKEMIIRHQQSMAELKRIKLAEIRKKAKEENANHEAPETSKSQARSDPPPYEETNFSTKNKKKKKNKKH